MTIRMADGSSRAGKPGDRIGIGESLETSAAAVARVSYENGSQLVLADGTKATFREEAADGASVPSVELDKGDLRALVEPAPAAPAKPETPNGDGSPPPKANKPVRFMLHTNSLAMGVRGTNFIVTASGLTSTLNTFQGSVEIGAGTFVEANQSVRAEHGKPAEAVKAFDPAAFLRQFHARHPGFDDMWNLAVKDAESGAVRKRFEPSGGTASPEETKLEKAKGQETEIEFKGKPKTPPKKPIPADAVY